MSAGWLKAVVKDNRKKVKTRIRLDMDCIFLIERLGVGFCDFMGGERYGLGKCCGQRCLGCGWHTPASGAVRYACWNFWFVRIMGKTWHN